MERNPTKDSTTTAGGGSSSATSWTDNYSSSTTGTTTGGDPIPFGMNERWNNSSWSTAAAMLGWLGHPFGRPTNPSSQHSLIQVTPNYRHHGSPRTSLPLAQAAAKHLHRKLQLEEHPPPPSLFASPSVRSHTTSKSKESETTIPLSNLTRHVRARRSNETMNFQTIEEGEDSSSSDVMYTMTKSSQSKPTSFPTVVVGQKSESSNSSSGSNRARRPMIPTVRGVVVQQAPVLAPEVQHQALTSQGGPLVPATERSNTVDPDQRVLYHESKEPASNIAQQQPSPEKRLVADVIAASLQLPGLTRAPAVSSPQPMVVNHHRSPDPIAASPSSPPQLSSIPSSPAVRLAQLGSRAAPVLFQPRPIRPEPPSMFRQRPPDALDDVVRSKIASLRQTLLEPTEQLVRPTTIPPSVSVDAPETSPRTAKCRPDAPSSSSSSSSGAPKPREPAPEHTPRRQRVSVPAPKATRATEPKTTTTPHEKKTSLHSLVYTSCSEDDDDDAENAAAPDAHRPHPPAEPSCTSSPKPCSTILESTLVTSPISNLTTDMRLIVAAHTEEKKQAEPHDDDNNTNRAIVVKKALNKRPKAKQSKKPVAASNIPSMRLVDNVRFQDPYGDMGVYSGVLVRNQPESHGTMRYDDGRTYTGAWKRGRWHGYGKAVFANGDSYMGEYEADVRNGIGRYEWADGRVFDGRFVKDQREGSGTYSWPDGSVYAGNFHGGLRHGSGTFTFADGSVYSGDWENGKQHGTGECVWRDGRCYRGTWVTGRAHGYGVEVRADGSLRHEGLWELDRPVRSAKTNDEES